ncbi:UNVERIFIED_CONTAM: hypothetical protein GTU68_022426, partial [Idotea baltica]|nr:hypothetical protein [Idotea baltica]
ADLSKNISETADRLSVVRESIKAYFSRSKGFESVSEFNVSEFKDSPELNFNDILRESQNSRFTERSQSSKIIEGVFGEDGKEILSNLDSISSVSGVSAAHNLAQTASDAQLKIKKKIKDYKPIIEKPLRTPGIITDDQLEAIDQKLFELQGSEHLHDQKVFSEIEDNIYKPNESKEKAFNKEELKENIEKNAITDPTLNSAPLFVHSSQIPQAKLLEKKPLPQTPKLIGRKPLAKSKAKSTLSTDAQARKVPQSRISRLATFGGLAAGLGMGTIAEMTRRTLGGKGAKESGSLLDASPFLTEANAKRIVDTLCKVRGAALKLGQMLSIQDNALLNPQLQKIFERVRQSADFMPTWQLERTLINDLGPDWRSLVSSFDDKPFAAASIGQVHQAVLHDGRSVAMKIQYPGVAEGIESDINNLISTLNVANILPEGLFVDNVIEVAKKELRWECDYEREKQCTKYFRSLIQGHPEYYVPEVVDELCTKQVFTTELIEGIPVDQCVSLDQETRNYIASLILQLCLMEVFQFGYMQTDPNWSNFFYNKETRQLALLDFGACRSYDKEFVDKYINIIHGAATKDREKVLEYSKQLEFLTGYEAKVMINAHIDAVMILGEAFQDDAPFHFGSQETTRRIQHLVPVMLSHRMCAPPEESYSLHRKMSGVFLLCAKLDAVMNCKPFFDGLWARYEVGGDWERADEVS